MDDQANWIVLDIDSAVGKQSCEAVVIATITESEPDLLKRVAQGDTPIEPDV